MVKTLEARLDRLYPELQSGWDELAPVHQKIQQYRNTHADVFDGKRTALGQELFDTMQQSVNAVLSCKGGSLPTKDMLESAFAAVQSYNRMYIYEPGIVAGATLPDDFDHAFSKSAIHVAKNKIAFGVLASLDDMIQLVAPKDQRQGRT